MPSSILSRDNAYSRRACFRAATDAHISQRKFTGLCIYSCDIGVPTGAACGGMCNHCELSYVLSDTPRGILTFIALEDSLEDARRAPPRVRSMTNVSLPNARCLQWQACHPNSSEKSRHPEPQIMAYVPPGRFRMRLGAFGRIFDIWIATYRSLGALQPYAVRSAYCVCTQGLVKPKRVEQAAVGAMRAGEPCPNSVE